MIHQSFQMHSNGRGCQNTSQTACAWVFDRRLVTRAHDTNTRDPNPEDPCFLAPIQVNDRRLVHERMVAHVRKPDATPLLVFPEGTCVNNEYCVMFKRGAFDLGATVCPIAIKYNPFFVDAFWNSKRQSLRQHIVSAPARPPPK